MYWYIIKEHSSLYISCVHCSDPQNIKDKSFFLWEEQVYFFDIRGKELPPYHI